MTCTGTSGIAATSTFLDALTATMVRSLSTSVCTVRKTMAELSPGSMCVTSAQTLHQRQKPGSEDYWGEKVYDLSENHCASLSTSKADAWQ